MSGFLYSTHKTIEAEAGGEVVARVHHGIREFHLFG